MMKHLVKLLVALVLAVLTVQLGKAEVRADDSQPQELSEEGTAYAVLTDEGDLIFFRSNESYQNKVRYDATDVTGNQYSGIVYTGIETLNLGMYKYAPWYSQFNSGIVRVRCADGQMIRPVSTARWFYECNQMVSADFSGFVTDRVTDTNYMFCSCSKLEQVNLDTFDTGNVTNMQGMFDACMTLKDIDLSNFDTSKVTDMSLMFERCSSLKTLDLKNFDTSSVENMGDMFDGCYDLESVDLSSFDTSNVTNIGHMFGNCRTLKSLDLSNFNTEKVKLFTWMFESCRNLESVDLSSFKTDQAVQINGMFIGCEKLQSVDLSHFNTENVTDMNTMFMACRSLEELDLSSFDTSKVTDMSGMFQVCGALEKLDLSSFDTQNVTTMAKMFDGCAYLSTVKLGPKFTKWINEAYLPAGKWNHGNLSLSETELYNQYPSNAESYAGTWEKNDQLIKAEEIRLNMTECAIPAGSGIQLTAEVLPANTSNPAVNWYTYDHNLIVVDMNGYVRAVAPGIATVYADTIDGVSAQCKVRVLFSDVADSKKYFYNPVYWAFDNEITVGAGGPGKFSPNASCTREQFVTFLWRMNGEPEPEEEINFSDVPENAWYYKSITWAAGKGITVGLNDGTGRFGVGQACTREQCVTFLHRSADKPAVTKYTDFSDVTADRYYYEAISWAAEKGITVGLNDGTGRFGVGQKCTRGMLVTFLQRFSETKNSEK